jgi:hypothetical protein
VEEWTVGTGAACGAIYLDQAFEKLILSKFDTAGFDLGEKRLDGLRDYFATTIKHRFNPFDPRVQSEYKFQCRATGYPGHWPQRRIPDAEKVQPLFEGDENLNFRRDIEGVFEPVFLQILDLIRGQLDTAREKEGKTIKVATFVEFSDSRLVLVGGLGSSLYLLDFLWTKLKQLDVKQPDVRLLLSSFPLIL